ncbi:MAG TPA: hypothetical protein VHI95_10625 [Acidimicrobiales bacterium]|nr:hypothetical protein [Acidimicrobiales bacterium]
MASSNDSQRRAALERATRREVSESISMVAERIVCVDCGGGCGRLTLEPELGWQAGDVVAYRCADCADVWYLELEADDIAE